MSSKGIVGGMFVVVIIVSACSDPLPTTNPPDSELRLQIHAATGHEPPECTDFGKVDAELEITTDGFDAACIKVALASVLRIVNNTAVEQRFMVGDPANSEVGRHLRVDETIAPGASYSLDPVDALLGVEIYPFWLQGLQEEGYAGSLIVTP